MMKKKTMRMVFVVIGVILTVLTGIVAYKNMH